jgi:nitroimidazol reductase NimA-like FMN-containing flavoprotein (pyridoxamine 5'-phosphate oxidase superfamily)
MSYPKDVHSTANRYRTRASYEYSAVHSIVNSSAILHVSFIPDESEEAFPTTLPMIGQMGSFSDPSVDPASEPLDLYIHGHISSRLMRLPECVESGGLPLCVSATILDGVVLALTPFSHSCNYRSAVVFGHASVVEDEAEKLFAMKLITNGMVADRWDNARVPPTKTELQSTQILRIKVKTASAKIRTGGPNDDRKDLKNDDLTKRVWTGVLPIWECAGIPLSGANNKVRRVPGYLEQWRVKKNEPGKNASESGVVGKIASYLESLFNIVYR